MKIYNFVLFLFTIILFSCSTKTIKKIPVLETSKESSLANIWIDAATNHKIEKIVKREGNNRSFYFHNNPFYKSLDGKDDLMIFSGSVSDGNQFFSVNLRTNQIEQVTYKKGRKKGEILGSKTRKVFYMINDSVFYTHLDTKKTEFIYKFHDSVIGSITSLNADEKLLGGALITKEENEILKKNPKKTGYFDKIYEAKLERSLVILDVNSKKLEQIYSENAWLNHIQFSPTNPDVLMYCHEGPWHKVDRIWNIHIKTKENKLIHKRTVEREIAGHEFFSPDGNTIWYDLQVPRSVTFYLAGKNIETGKETRYGLKRDEWSIHYNIAPDMKTFAGDGGDESQVARAKDAKWIYHFIPKNDSLAATKLVNMKNHNYDLEPNIHFTPDGKQLIFRANFEGSTQIYRVNLQKEQ
ncbi:hypothetical protein BW723_07045 [Polaribacter reichenbachii]|uniref:Oligogalacturonate lyase domain-containing protein n=1 Tax=Polaribacter reichenbachii TaxID=996801 RepID=A0A1B8U6R4_9FLAO|nr:oligogalacturonate lyase family protein [Polaribacter reichenbachii]APZ46067.1 hypothetical protein BW723_07045 [Polaribacter reichenbachii]AUC19929.1 hypothetical protein BTO17_15065 [Polaribacter reichenbachii]OBY67527.1 hypothetical protein LPB301_02445 [Polaribacter reichenbachii]